MITFKSFLAEARMAPLYHTTNIRNAREIIEDNKLNRGWPDPSGHWHAKNGEIISLTRNLPFALMWKGSYGVVLELDQQKLSHNYKIVPFSYFARSMKGSRRFPTQRTVTTGKDYDFDNQFEESIVNADVTNINKYITKIIIMERGYNRYKDTGSAQPIIKHPLLWIYEQKKFINK